MDNKLARLVLVLFVAQQLMCAPLEACAQERPAGTQTLAAAGAAGQADSAGASGASASARTAGSASGSTAGSSKAQKPQARNNVSAKKRPAATGRDKTGAGIHAPAWAFDSGAHSREAWRDGTSSRELKKRAVGEEAAKDDSVNSASGINSALKTATNKAERKNGLAVSVGQDESAWRKKSQMEPETVDENIPMQSRHVVRAYADVDAGDDLNIRVGPELILKDEQRERTATNKQPESALGMGMQFKLGF